MYTLEQLPEFEEWFHDLRDRTIKNRLLARFARLENGNLGDYKTIEGQLLEWRIARLFCDPWWTDYFTAARRQ